MGIVVAAGWIMQTRVVLQWQEHMPRCKEGLSLIVPRLLPEGAGGSARPSPTLPHSCDGRGSTSALCAQRPHHDGS